jgi:hypothetical protein
MYYEKNSHYGKIEFWEKRYAEYFERNSGIHTHLTGTRIGPHCAISLVSMPRMKVKF